MNGVKNSYLCSQNLNVIFLLVTRKIGHHLTMTREHKLTEKLSDSDRTLCGKMTAGITGSGTPLGESQSVTIALVSGP